MTIPFDDLHFEYGSASGLSYLDCAFVGRRWRDAYGTTMLESDFWICVNQPIDAENATTYTRWGPWPNLITGLWRSATSGRVYAADASQGSVHIWDDVMDASQPARVHKLGFAPEGI